MVTRAAASSINIDGCFRLFRPALGKPDLLDVVFLREDDAIMHCCLASFPDLRLFLPPLRPSLSRKQSVVAAYRLIPVRTAGKENTQDVQSLRGVANGLRSGGRNIKSQGN